MRRLGQSSHELVELGHKLLLDTLRPVLLSQELWQVLSIHLVQQIIQRIAID
jgi:hypothetical protein